MSETNPFNSHKEAQKAQRGALHLEGGSKNNREGREGCEEKHENKQPLVL
jgi:hypothetical protein